VSVAALLLTLPPASPAGADAPGRGAPAMSLGSTTAVPAVGHRPVAPPPPVGAAWTTQYTLFVSNGTLRAGNEVIPPPGEPWQTAYDPVNDRLYFSSDCTVYEADPSTFQVVGTITSSEGCGVVFDPATGDLYLNANGNVSVVDPSTGALVSRIRASDAGLGLELFVFDPRANAVLVGGSIDSQVDVVNLTQGRTVATIPIGWASWSGAYDPINGNVYLGSYENDTLEIVNSSTWSVTYDALSVGLFLMGVAVDPQSGNLFVTTRLNPELAEISGATGKVLNSTGLGSYVSGIAVDPARGLVYVADSQQSRIYAVRASNLTTAATLSLDTPGLGLVEPWPLAYVPVLQTLYAPTSAQESLLAISSVNDSVYGTIGGLMRPDAELWDPACACTVVGDYLRERLYFVNGTTDVLERTVPLPGWPRGLTYDNATQTLWVGTGGLTGGSGLVILDANNGTRVATLDSGAWFNAPAFDPVNGKMFAPDVLGNTVVVFNATTGNQTGVVNASYASGAAWDPTNDRVYVSDWEANNVTVVDGANDTVAQVIRHVPGPNEILYDPATGLVYTGDENAPNVTVIDPVNSTIAENLSAPGYAGSLLALAGTPTLVVGNATGNLTLLNLSSGARSYVAMGAENLGLAETAAGTIVGSDWDAALYFANRSTPNLLTTPTLTLSPSLLPEGGNVTVTASTGGGSPPYGYVYQGLPPGCASEDLATFQCAPTAPGLYHVSVAVNDSTGETLSTRAELWVEPVYPVTFDAAGLGPGVAWWVNVTGAPARSTANGTLGFDALNASYTYSIGVDSDLYVPTTNATGAFTVDGAAVVVQVTFERVSPVTFTASGLPNGTVWQVTLTGHAPERSNGSTLALGALPGGYSYVAMVPAGGYGALRGVLTVSTSAVNVSLTFLPFTYTALFEENGLSAGYEWYLNLSNGASLTSVSTSVSVPLSNGTTGYASASAGGRFHGVDGTVRVSGGGVAVTISFFLETYPVSFAVSGPPAGTPYNITIAQATHSGSGPVLGIAEPNGTYAYTATAGPYWLPVTGAVGVAGAAVGVPVAFAPATRMVTFDPVGLASTADWWVNVSGAGNFTARGTAIAVPLDQGLAYTYTAAGPPDQAPEAPRSGSIPLGSTDLTYRVVFAAPLVVAAFTASPGAVVVGSIVDLNVTLRGGASPFAYAYAGLPPGCTTVDRDYVECQPTSTGNFTVSVRATDADGSTANATVHVAVTNAAAGPLGGGSAPPPSWVFVALGAAAALGAVTFLLPRRRGRRTPAGATPDGS
jgi:DNA-binding beta-propeller fold protein YncE